jgi:hypothetical protein
MHYEQKSNHNAIETGKVPGHPEVIQWRPWPCADCCHNQSYQNFLSNRFGASSQLSSAVIDIDQINEEELRIVYELIAS